MQQIREWRDVDGEMFRNRILPLAQPAVLRGLISQWPAVREAQRSGVAACGYVKRFDRGQPVETFVGAPAIKGQFFYQQNMRGVNFERVKLPLGAAIERLLAVRDDPAPPAIYAGAVSVPECLPEFARDNRTVLVPDSVAPRLWIGNAVTVTTHYDISDNLACVVGGRRRFTLFPPEQLPNLYVGPLEFTLAGQPVSMVRLHDPDFARYPRFQQALDVAQQAELGPGDALYIPYLWWHHVQSLEPLNVLVNYWWNDAKPWTGSPFECMVHGILSIRDLPPQRREAWRKIFEHYVFQKEGDPVEHLAPEHRGILGALTPQLAKHIRYWLIHALNR